MTAVAIRGANKILYVGSEITGTTGSLKGARLDMQTTHNISGSADSNDTTTKDGKLSVFDEVAYEGSIESVASDGEVAQYLRDSLNKKKDIPLWEVDMSKVGTDTNAGKYPARYMQARVNNIEEDADSDDFATLKADLTIYGIPVDGFVTVPANDVAAIQYAFRELDATTEATAGDAEVGESTAE